MDEPRRHPRYLILLAVAAVGTVPFAFIRTPPMTILGLPLWLWSSMVFTTVLAGLTVWGILRYWKDDSGD